MTHFTLEQWADFARSTAKPKENRDMQAHLDAGCRRCTSAVRLLGRICEIASRERAFKAPDEVVRTVKGMFVVRRGRKSPALALLFDSLLTPMVGVRSSATTARQLLYAAGAYRIDLRMEPQTDTENVAVVGQVLNSSDPTQMIPTIPVALTKNRKPISTAQTGNFGEFQLQCKLSDRLHLQLRLPDGVGIEIPLLEPSKAALTGQIDIAHKKGFSSDKSSLRRGTSKKV